MLIVQKYGGTSVANRERIEAVADRVLASQRSGEKIVVVVSAMAGETNRLLNLSKEMLEDPQPLYRDLLISTGEQVSVALLCMALEKRGHMPEPFLGYQVRITTDGQHGRARIRKIDVERVRDVLNRGSIAVVAGFQGVTETGAITTIGRGGSDTTAVAIAAALEADRCDIYTDVDGVYTADPRLVPNARLLTRLSYEEMLEMADAGAKVLQTRSVEIAARYNVPLTVRSSFGKGEGTRIVAEEVGMEETLVSSITLNRDEAKIAIRQVPDQVGVTARIFRKISEAGIVVDMIVQNVSKDGLTDLTFTVPKEDLRRSLQFAETSAKEVGAGKVEAAADIAKIAVVGVGMRSHAGVAYAMFEALAKEGIGIQMISTSEIKVSIVIDIKYAELAVRVLHEAFELNG